LNKDLENTVESLNISSFLLVPLKLAFTSINVSKKEEKEEEIIKSLEYLKIFEKKNINYV